MNDLDSCNEHHSPCDHAQDDKGSKIRLDNDQKGKKEKDHKMGEKSYRKKPDLFLFFGQGITQEKNQGEFCKFRWLKA